MGTLTKAEMEVEVRAALGGRTDLDSRLGRALNLAQQRLARMRDFEEMQVISSTTIQNTGKDNDRFLALPTVREIYSIVLLNGAQSRKVVGRTAQWMDRNIGMPEYFAREIPSNYNLWGFNIEWFPLPMQNYSIRMRWTKWPADLVEDENISEFHQKDEIIIELTLSYLNRTLGKTDKADQHEGAAKKLLEEAKEVDRTRPDENITPGMSDIAAVGSMQSEPWNNPFVRDTFSRP